MKRFKNKVYEIAKCACGENYPVKRKWQRHCSSRCRRLDYEARHPRK